MFYPETQYSCRGFQISHKKQQRYDAVLVHTKTAKQILIPFGNATMKAYHDLTGLNAFPHLLHNDPELRQLYHLRNDKHIRAGYFSPVYFTSKYLF